MFSQTEMKHWSFLPAWSFQNLETPLEYSYFHDNTIVCISSIGFWFLRTEHNWKRWLHHQGLAGVSYLRMLHPEYRLKNWRWLYGADAYRGLWETPARSPQRWVRKVHFWQTQGTGYLGNLERRGPHPNVWVWQEKSGGEFLALLPGLEKLLKVWSEIPHGRF